MIRRGVLLGWVLAGVGGAAALGAMGPRSHPGPESAPNPRFQEEDVGPPYDGRFTFIRVRFGNAGSDLRDFGFGRRGRGRGRQPPWQHDFPRAERNFAKILDATTYVDTYMEGTSGRILTLDDPELFKYPMAYLIEVGYWQPSVEEVRGLRDYLLKGGFLIVDDFRGRDIDNFVYQMRRVLPGYEIQFMPLDHEIYDSFFHIEDPEALLPPYGREVPTYLGIFEDNDPIGGRIMVMINYNQDIQEYWEYSDLGYYPIDLSNDAYKFGVNYVIYAYTH
jgi:hypothetical protein